MFVIVAYLPLFNIPHKPAVLVPLIYDILIVELLTDKSEQDSAIPYVLISDDPWNIIIVTFYSVSLCNAFIIKPEKMLCWPSLDE